MLSSVLLYFYHLIFNLLFNLGLISSPSDHLWFEYLKSDRIGNVMSILLEYLLMVLTLESMNKSPINMALSAQTTLTY